MNISENKHKLKEKMKVANILYVQHDAQENSSATKLEEVTRFFSRTMTCVFTVVMNTFDALDQFEATRFKLVIVQQNQLSMTRVDTVRMVHKLNSSVPVILLTDVINSQSVMSLQQLMGSSFGVLPMPVPSPELCQMICHSLRQAPLSMEGFERMRLGRKRKFPSVNPNIVVERHSKPDNGAAFPVNCSPRCDVEEEDLTASFVDDFDSNRNSNENVVCSRIGHFSIHRHTHFDGFGRVNEAEMGWLHLVLQST